jgi:hypothetical protein
MGKDAPTLVGPDGLGFDLFDLLMLDQLVDQEAPIIEGVALDFGRRRPLPVDLKISAHWPASDEALPREPLGAAFCDPQGFATPEQKRWIVERDGHRCVACLWDYTYGDLIADHIIPHSYGGWTVVQNLQTMCRWCNSRKRDRCMDDWRWRVHSRASLIPILTAPTRAAA